MPYKDVYMLPFSSANPPMSHSGLILLRWQVVCLVNKRHRCLHKSDAPIRNQNIHHVHRGMNTQGSLYTCEHLIRNMIRTVDTKVHVNAVIHTHPPGDFTQPDTRDLTPLWPGHKRFARGTNRRRAAEKNTTRKEGAPRRSVMWFLITIIIMCPGRSNSWDSL